MFDCMIGLELPLVIILLSPLERSTMKQSSAWILTGPLQPVCVSKANYTSTQIVFRLCDDFFRTRPRGSRQRAQRAAGDTPLAERAWYPKGRATPGKVSCQGGMCGALSKLKRHPSQRKINLTSKFPVGDTSVVTLMISDTTLDHRRKAEKV